MILNRYTEALSPLTVSLTLYSVLFLLYTVQIYYLKLEHPDSHHSALPQINNWKY